VLSELLAGAREFGVDLIGEPRLVRLNPNIPWKTRGNAALAAQFGRGDGPRRRIAEIGGRPVWSYPHGRRPAGPREAGWIERAWQIVRQAARVGSAGTDPALVAVSRPLPPRLYWRAVREVVDVAETRQELERHHAVVRTLGGDRGLVGAAAAVAWPESHPTWELIAYRPESRWGRPREVDRASVRRAARDLPELFLCEDARTRRLMVAPHTPCPILFGLRGRTPAAALAGRRMVRSERTDRWVLFRTNQGSGDHLVPRRFSDSAPYTSGSWVGTLPSAPTVGPGGHVAFSVADQDGPALDCVAFEPTKTLPRVARSLRPGDRVRVWGSRADDPVVRVEGIELLRLVPRFGPRRVPRCPACQRAADSLGRQRGFRCANCHRRWPPEAARGPTRIPEYDLGTYHPTPSARRHLAPLGPEP
jgi:tRNA(Ile2)-agmatinylcytidine synthase